jgi:hypothetical protein
MTSEKVLCPQYLYQYETPNTTKAKKKKIMPIAAAQKAG